MKLSKTKACEMFGVKPYELKKHLENTPGGVPWISIEKINRVEQSRVDVDDPVWLEFVAMAHEKQKRKRAGVPRTSTPSIMGSDAGMRALEKKSVKAQLEMPIVKLKHEKFRTRSAETNLQKLSGDLIPFQISEVYFFSFADRLSNEALRCGVKLRKRIREDLAATFVQRIPSENLTPEVDAAVREFLKGAEIKELAVKIEHMVIAEIEESIRDVKADQRLAIESWKDDEAIA